MLCLKAGNFIRKLFFKNSLQGCTALFVTGGSCWPCTATGPPQATDGLETPKGSELQQVHSEGWHEHLYKVTLTSPDRVSLKSRQ